MAEEKTKLKRYWSEQAVNLALQGKWADAIAANQNILALFPSDAEAYNRLGKAYTELGKYNEARDSYEHSLQIDPGNSIAVKNLQRLAHLTTSPPLQASSSVATEPEGYLAPQMFIEEMGKTRTTSLVNPAPLKVLATMSAGDPVQLVVENRILVVLNVRGERLGEVEPKLGQRLIGFIKAGNRYSAAISSIENSGHIIIRETFQHPSQAGRVSFPGKGGDSGFRSYIKESVLKYDLDEEEEEAAEEPEAAVEGEVAADEPIEEPETFEEDLGNVDDK